jgi:hypothetical protein
MIFNFLKEQQMNKNNKYCIVVTEWLYPTESGRDLEGDYDTYEQAIEAARQLVEDERRDNWTEATHTDPTTVDYYIDSDGYIITDKSGLEDWWFQAKVIKVNYGL